MDPTKDAIINSLIQYGGHNRIDLSDKEVTQIDIMTRKGLPMKDIAEILGIGEATLKRIAQHDNRFSHLLFSSNDFQAFSLQE